MVKKILCRDLSKDVSFREFAQRSCVEGSFLYRDLVQRSCQEVSRDFARIAFLESLYRDFFKSLSKRSLTEILPNGLL